MEDLGKLLLRVLIASLFLVHGTTKVLYGITPVEDAVLAHGLPHFVSYGVYIGEVVAPIFVFLGLFTRPAALIMSFNMIVAILLMHMNQLTSLNSVGGYQLELQMLYLFGSLAIALLGGGRYGFRTRMS